MTIRQIPDQIAFSTDQAAKVALAEGEHCRANLWCLEPGQEIQPHVHAGDHAWTVQEGEGWFLAGPDAHPVSAGTFLFAPAGESHGMRAKTRLVFVSVTAG